MAKRKATDKPDDDKTTGRQDHEVEPGTEPEPDNGDNGEPTTSPNRRQGQDDEGNTATATATATTDDTGGGSDG